MTETVNLECGDSSDHEPSLHSLHSIKLLALYTIHDPTVKSYMSVVGILKKITSFSSLSTCHNKINKRLNKTWLALLISKYT